METVFAILITIVYFFIGYKLSQVITINREQYSPVLICLWPVIFVLLGVAVISTSINDIFRKHKGDKHNG